MFFCTFYLKRGAIRAKAFAITILLSMICLKFYIYLKHMKFLRKSLLLTATVSAALVIAGCKEEPNPKAMAQNEASAVAPDEDAPVKSKIKAKVRKSVGETELSKNQGETWKRLITGQKVVENNRIRTAVESEAVLAVEDGSSLWIT